MNKLCYVLLMCALCSCDQGFKDNSNTETQTKEQILVSRLDSIINPFIDSGFVGAVLIADMQKIILNKSYGKSKTPLDSNTVFWIASNTKPITAMAVMKLVEDGKLSVKDSLTQFFKNVPSDKIHITVEQLLTHSSGIPSEFVAEGEQNKEIAIKKILSQKLLSRPGEQEHYSNDGYDLLGAIIEMRSGKSYQEYVREVIFEKAGMTNSNFMGSSDVVVDPPHDSIIYQPFYKKIFKDGKPIPNLPLTGSGGISSNTLDLYRLMEALKRGKIINQNSLQELFKPRIEIAHQGDTTVSWAYGWVVQTIGEKTEIRHSGRSDWNHNSRIFFLSNGYKVIIWARDNGPLQKAWATEISYPLVNQIYSIKSSQ